MPGPIAIEDLVLKDDPGISAGAVLLGGRGGRFEKFASGRSPFTALQLRPPPLSTSADAKDASRQAKGE
jgi:hypothetical protein